VGGWDQGYKWAGYGLVLTFLGGFYLKKMEVFIVTGSSLSGTNNLRFINMVNCIQKFKNRNSNI